MREMTWYHSSPSSRTTIFIHLNYLIQFTALREVQLCHQEPSQNCQEPFRNVWVSWFVEPFWLPNFEGKWRILSRFPATVRFDVGSPIRYEAWVMGSPCSYLFGTCFSKICNFYHEAKSKSSCERKFIIHRSSVEAIYQSQPLSPIPILFYCRNGLLYFHCPFSDGPFSSNGMIFYHLLLLLSFLLL